MINDDSQERQYMAIGASRLKNYLIILSLCSSGFHMGYYMAVFNPMGSPLFKDVYGMNEIEKDNALGDIFMIFSIGGLCGAVAAGKLIEVLGRRWSMIGADIFAVIVIAWYSVKSVAVLYILRFFSGFIAGFSSLASAIIMKELLPKEISGVGNSITTALVTSVVFLAYIQQNIFSRETLVENWKLFMCWPIIPATIKAVIFMVLVKTDTAKHYISHHRKEDNIDDTLTFILLTTHEPEVVPDLVKEMIITYDAEHQNNKGKKNGLGTIFNKDNLKKTIAGSIIGLTQQLSGTPMFNLYSTDIFDKLSGNGKEVTLSIAIAKVVGGVAGVVFVKYFKRKVNVIFGLFMQLISLLMIGFSVYYGNTLIPYIMVFVFMVFFSTGVGSTFLVYAAEVLNPISASFAGSLVGISSAILSKIIPLMIREFSLIGVLSIFSIACLVLLVVIDYFMVETKDKKDYVVIEEFKTRGYKFLNFN